jgi:hypothetical protein
MPEEITSSTEEGKTFTQADVDRIVTDRLNREKGKYADYDELKTKAAKVDELEAASKSELQKALDEVAERDKRLAEIPTQIRRQVVRFASQATQAGFIDPEDALSFLPADIDLADDDAVKTALGQLAERKPHLVRAEKPKPRERPKPKAGEAGSDPDGEEPKGKERAAAALRQFRNTR